MRSLPERPYEPAFKFADPGDQLAEVLVHLARVIAALNDGEGRRAGLGAGCALALAGGVLAPARSCVCGKRHLSQLDLSR